DARGLSVLRIRTGEPIIRGVNLLGAVTRRSAAPHAGEILLSPRLRVGQLTSQVLALQRPVGRAEEPEQVQPWPIRCGAAGLRRTIQRRTIGRVDCVGASGRPLQERVGLGY